jgi:hypothetical protein
MSFGRRKAILDQYGELIEVNVDEGDADVTFSLTRPRGESGMAISSLTADDADNMAEQLHAAAAHARTLTPHD